MRRSMRRLLMKNFRLAVAQFGWNDQPHEVSDYFRSFLAVFFTVRARSSYAGCQSDDSLRGSSFTSAGTATSFFKSPATRNSACRSDRTV
jgi:hypothetical protein